MTTKVRPSHPTDTNIFQTPPGPSLIKLVHQAIDRVREIGQSETDGSFVAYNMLLDLPAHPLKHSLDLNSERKLYYGEKLERQMLKPNSHIYTPMRVTLSQKWPLVEREGFETEKIFYSAYKRIAYLHLIVVGDCLQATAALTQVDLLKELQCDLTEIYQALLEFAEYLQKEHQYHIQRGSLTILLTKGVLHVE